MKHGKLLEQIVWTQDLNTITLTRTMDAVYNIVDGKIAIESAGGDGDEYEFDGPDAEELEALLDDELFVEAETFEEMGFEQTDYILEEIQI